MVVDLLKNASQKSQVLVTTHSPYLVDLLQPEDLFTVEKQEGKTIVKKAGNKSEIIVLRDFWSTSNYEK